MRVLQTKTEQNDNGWVAKIYDSGILIHTTEVFETESESKEAALQKAVELQS